MEEGRLPKSGRGEELDEEDDDFFNRRKNQIHIHDYQCPNCLGTLDEEGWCATCQASANPSGETMYVFCEVCATPIDWGTDECSECYMEYSDLYWDDRADPNSIPFLDLPFDLDVEDIYVDGDCFECMYSGTNKCGPLVKWLQDANKSISASLYQIETSCRDFVPVGEVYEDSSIDIN